MGVMMLVHRYSIGRNTSVHMPRFQEHHTLSEKFFAQILWMWSSTSDFSLFQGNDVYTIRENYFPMPDAARHCFSIRFIWKDQLVFRNCHMHDNLYRAYFLSKPKRHIDVSVVSFKHFSHVVIWGTRRVFLRLWTTSPMDISISLDQMRIADRQILAIAVIISCPQFTRHI